MRLATIYNYAASCAIEELVKFLEDKKETIGDINIKRVKLLELYSPDDEDCVYVASRKSELNVPILYAADDTECYKMSTLISMCINDINIRWYTKLLNIGLELNDISLKRPSFDNLMNYFSNVVNNPVIVYDEFFNVLEKTHDWITEYDRSPKGYESLKLNNLIYYKQQVEFTDDNAPVKTCDRLLFPALIGDMARGYLALFMVETSLEEMNELVLNMFANVVLMEIKKRLEIANIENRHITNFIYDVIYKNLDSDEISRRAKALRLDADGRYVMIAIVSTGKMNLLKNDTIGYITKIESLNERIVSAVANFHKTNYPEDVITKYGDNIHVLHKVRGTECQKREIISAMNEMCSNISAVLESQFEGMNFQFGIGEEVYGLNNINSSFDQALATINYGQMVHGTSRGFVMAYGNNSMLKLYGRLRDTGSFDEIVPENLRRLYENEKPNEHQLYNTLKVYLDSNCNAKKAAEKLFIHYKTMLYRLEKIRRDYGIDLENSNSRLYTELGIQLIDMKNIMG